KKIQNNKRETPAWNIIWNLDHSNLFRISYFEFRISKPAPSTELFSGLLHLRSTRSIRRTRKMEPNKSTSLPPKKLRVLVVDDEKNIRATLSLCLEQLGCAVTATATPEAALTALRQQPYDLAFLDLRLGESNGLDLIPKLLTIDAGLQVIVITAYAT